MKDTERQNNIFAPLAMRLQCGSVTCRIADLMKAMPSGATITDVCRLLAERTLCDVFYSGAGNPHGNIPEGLVKLVPAARRP